MPGNYFILWGMSSLWNFALNVIAIAAGLWVVVEFVPGIDLTTAAGEELTAFLVLAVVFVLVNTVVAPVIRLLGMPLTCITLGLFALVINGIVLMIAEWLFNVIDLQDAHFAIEGLWPAIIGAIVLGIISSIVNFFTSPLGARS